MNGGYKAEPLAILKVEDSSGKTLEETKPKKGKRVLTKEGAFLIADILSDNDARTEIFGPNSALVIPDRTVAVKTGTTNDKRDNWTVGGNTQGVVGVWVGNNDNSPMLQVASGITGASPIWRRITLELLSDKPNVGFEVPAKIVTAAVDAISGYAAHDGFPSKIEYFIKGTEPGEDQVHVKLKVCKSEGKLATPSDIAGGNYEEREYIVISEDDPTARAGAPNRWQEAYLAWTTTQSDSRYHPPNDYCGAGNPLNVEFISPHDQNSNLPNTFSVKVTADSTSDISQITLYIDDVKERTFTGPPYEHAVNLTTGVHELKAVAKDVDGNESDRKITIGVNVTWDWAPTPTPTVIPTPIPSPTATPVPSPTP